MNFSKFQQVLNSYHSESVDELLKVFHSLIADNVFSFYDNFDIQYDDFGAVSSLSVSFDNSFLAWQFKLLVNCGKSFWLEYRNGHFVLLIFTD